jgi:hypothetical protein
MESERLFKRMAWSLVLGLAAVGVFVTIMISRPDAYHEHLAHPVYSPRTTWPDGSLRTPDDWWAHPGAPETGTAATHG